MYTFQKEFLKALVKNDKRQFYHFPRQMGKTYVRDFIKQIGSVAARKG